MFRTIYKFFGFCNEKNRKQFRVSVVLGVLNAFFIAFRIPAIALMLSGITGGNVHAGHILGSLGILAASVTGQIIVYKKMAMLQTIAGYETAAGKRIEIAEHMRYMPMGYFNKNSLGEITSVTTNTMENLGDVATRVVMLTFQGILTTALMIVFMLFYDWRTGLIALAGFGVFFAVNSVMRKKTANISETKLEDDTRMTEKLLEYIQGITEVKFYNLTGFYRKNIDRVIEKASETNTEMEKKVNRYSPWQTIVTKATGTVMSIAAIAFFLGGSMPLMNCILMIISSFMVFSGLEQAGSFSALMRIVDISVDKANAVLSVKTMDINGENIIPATHDIEAQDITFAYDQRKIIDGVSITIPEKTTVAFVGPSGSGKTTLCHLLARFWDADEGRVSLDGRNVKDYSYDSLMENFSFVFQNVYLFHDTIANNIRFSRPEASMEEVIDAAKRACCHDFITELPNGYETVIGEGGASLSGGEKQRISIARAIMKDAPVIVLDEATANVDPETEKELMEAIEALTNEKTVFMIAHRLKTVRNADKICVIDKGQIVQQGTHDELISREGIYRDFVDQRNRAVSWKL